MKRSKKAPSIYRKEYNILNFFPKNSIPKKPKGNYLNSLKDKSIVIDVRDIDPEYFHPYKDYSIKEMELFQNYLKKVHNNLE